MKKYELGLIGYPLGHSFSKKYFTEKFDRENIAGYEYLNFPIESIGRIIDVLREHPCLVGFNVTIPYKEQILAYLDEIDEQAARIGAVNCVRVLRGTGDGKCGKGIRMKGYNTDAYGFESSLLKMTGDNRPAALVLGTGGASKAVIAVLASLNMPYLTVSRQKGKGDITYDELSPEIIGKHKLIVNCTPLGTYPVVDSCPPIDYEAVTPRHYLYDLVYNPSDTLFTRNGRKKGATVISGYAMLVAQAEKGWAVFSE